MTVYAAIKKAIKVVFSANKKVIDDSVHMGDPFGWAPKAEVTVSFENGLPSPEYAWQMAEKWVQVGEEASKLCGTDICVEPVNAAVGAVYSQ